MGFRAQAQVGQRLALAEAAEQLVDSVDPDTGGVRSRIAKNVTIRDTIILGADRYETDADRATNRANNRPDLLIGEGTLIQNAILDKEVRIGRNVKIVNARGVTDDEGDNYVIRDGIVAIPRGTIIPDGTVI